MMFFVVFLANNPYFGIALRKWPWEVFRLSEDPLARVTFVLWNVTALWALCSSFLERSSARTTVLMALGVPLLATAAGTGGAYPIERHHLGELLVLILIGAGLWLGARSRSGRVLGLLGGLVFFWMLAITNDPALIRSRLMVLGQELGQVFQGESVRPNEINYMWWNLVPYTLTALGALFAILQSVFRSMWISRVGWFLLLIGLVFSVGVSIATAPRITTNVVAAASFTTLVSSGVALWLFASFLIADAAREYETSTDGSTT